MPIKSLSTYSFRNLIEVSLEFGPRFNIFYGDNGAGKTSLLEALFYISRGRSFRTSLTNRIIHHSANQFVLFLEFEKDAGTCPVGIERHKDGSKRIRVDGKEIQSISALAKLLPIQFMSTKSYQYFTDGPKLRRQFMDWGVFHVKHEFMNDWQQIQQILKQRNAAIKKRLSFQEITAWDKEFSHFAERITQNRSEYLETLKPNIEKLLSELLPDLSMSLRYQRGWNKETPIEEILKSNIESDIRIGYTQSGPHRADLQLYVKNTPAADYLSQGQQKVASYVLYLAQGITHHQLTGAPPIYLIDDLPSELDSTRRKKVMDVLSELNGQVFITGITIEDLDDVIHCKESKMFHVKQGQINLVPELA